MEAAHDRYLACIVSLHANWAAFASTHHKRSLRSPASSNNAEFGGATAASTSSLDICRPLEVSACNPETERWLGRFCYENINDYYDLCETAQEPDGVVTHAGGCSHGTTCTQFRDSERDDHIVREPVPKAGGQAAGSSKPRLDWSTSSGSAGSDYFQKCLDSSDDEATSQLGGVSISPSP